MKTINVKRIALGAWVILGFGLLAAQCNDSEVIGIDTIEVLPDSTLNETVSDTVSSEVETEMETIEVDEEGAL
jgi:hypothetical protein